jgi:hypothetical protein
LAPIPLTITRALQAYLGHRNIQHTARFRESAEQPLRQRPGFQEDETTSGDLE